MLKYIISILIVFYSCNILFSQENKSLHTVYTEFNSFFDKEIKYQGVKGNWIFGLKEITAIHKFDYNNDGLLDVLLEFNAEPIDEGNYTNYYTVLFENLDDKNFKYVNYMESLDLYFKEYFDAVFTFKSVKKAKLIQYNLVDSKFVRIN